MKKIKLFILLLVAGLFSCIEVSAHTTLSCDYNKSYGGQVFELSVTFDINGDLNFVIIYEKNYSMQSTGSSVEFNDVTNLYTPNFRLTAKDECPKQLILSNGVMSIGNSTGNSTVYYLTNQKKEFIKADKCYNYKSKETCERSKNTGKVACVWNETEYGSYCNVNKLMFVKCGSAYDIPYEAPAIISFFYNFLKILAPIILIAVSIMSLIKALASSNEDEIKKAQKSLVRKIIAAVMIYFVMSIVQFIIYKVADDGELGDIDSCLACFLDNKCEDSIYIKANAEQEEPTCHYTASKEEFNCPGAGGYKITFNANGGKWRGRVSQTIERTVDGKLDFDAELNSEELIRDKYTFSGWAKKGLNGEIDCDNPLRDEITVIQDTEFYACWKQR